MRKVRQNSIDTQIKFAMKDAISGKSDFINWPEWALMA